MQIPDLLALNIAVTECDSYWMRHALQLAEYAASIQEVPVGAVLIRHGTILGEGYNQPIATHDPTAHAEMVALRNAARVAKNYRLAQTTLYVTLEPCLMCLGALVHARIERLVFGAYDLKAGVLSSQLNAANFNFLNHKINYQGGIMASECGSLLSAFFKLRR